MLFQDSEEINFGQILEFYKHHLHQKILPFWLNHCIDHKNGGINNCVRDDGKLPVSYTHLTLPTILLV